MGHVQGVDRSQVLLFPEVVDEYLDEANPVRFLDAFVDSLDLTALGFARALPLKTGRPPYHPGDLLKLYLYGYLNKIRSSRKLEQESGRNIELMWLVRKLQPDFKTIADFRKENTKALKEVCRAFTLLCRELNLFGGELVAVDGSKFKAVNSRDRNFTEKKLARLLTQIDEKIAAYLNDLDRQDQGESSPSKLTTEELKKKLERVRSRRDGYQQMQKALDGSDERQISLTDPDSRSMKVRQGTDVCYNVQTAVDAQHKLIVAHEVTNAVTDLAQLSGIAIAAKEALGVEHLEVVADQGYYNGQEVKTCLEAGIVPYISKPNTSANRKLGLFTKEDFRYDPVTDVYHCPAGEALPFHFENVEQGRVTRYYTTSACKGCALKPQCTRNKDHRRISRWAHEHVHEAMAKRVAEHPETLRQRKSLVEHPFGTMKRWMDQGYFLMRGLEKVRAEMSLTVFAYNLKRAMRILGVQPLMAAVR